ncbi:sigma-w pathway protein ysdB [Bacillus solimangrovi]|uniref:Sigma-w pathway protein ysdB n=1 Tax=Bacillus solimangrovi TaxID=1305675 RepID=A0A1E5LCT8_9BACI|nr:sigma-w pathway protein ysdB [Bacillus solimangrovi]OEH91880.1 sigma-w pathway protein ysdB [Bacillus solimangrovi]
MFVILFRFFIIIAVLVLLYSLSKYLLNPKRKLESAYEKAHYYLLDDVNNVRKNLFITYKGALFEGEKYLGTTDQAFEVVSITVWAHSLEKLYGLNRDDFYYLEKELLTRYPNAVIEWQSPIKDLLKTHH